MSITYTLTLLPFRVLFKLLYRVEIINGSDLCPSQGAVIASTHTSFFDPPLIGTTLPIQVHFLAKESLFNAPILSWILPRVNTHPVKGRSSTQSIRTVVRLISEQSKVVIFPEGHRSPDGETQPLEPGIGLIVAKAECPIIPCYIEGAYEIWGKKRRFPRLWGRIRIAYGAPIPWSQFADLPKRQRIEAIRLATEEALRELKEKMKT